MKACTKCKEVKPLAEFPVMKRRSDGRGSICNICKRKIDQAYYHKNPELTYQRREAHRQKSLAKIVEYLKEHPCVDCGETDILVLEFDHIDGSPEQRVASIVTRSWKIVLEEISKCEVRCSNCHTRITRKRANDWRYRYSLVV